MSRTKFVSLPKENLFAFANYKVYTKERVEDRPTERFVVGNKYSLTSDECEGFTMRTNIYELVRVVDTVNDIEFKSLVMKPIDIGSTTIYSLTRTDCQKLGIEFQEGLQLFPKDLDWKVIDDKPKKKVIDLNRDFDDSDLSTYPVSIYSRTVERIIIRLTGFTQITNQLVKTPYHSIVNIEDFLKKIYITYNKDCEPFENASKMSINGRVITPCFMENNNSFRLVDNSTNSIFIELQTTFRDMSNDKEYGIDPSFLEGKNINDLITVSWTENEEDKRIEDKKNRINSKSYEQVMRDMYLANAQYQHKMEADIMERIRNRIIPILT